MLGQQWTIYTLWHFLSLTLFGSFFSFRVVVVHLASLVNMTILRGVPSVGAMRKVDFSGGLMTVLSTGSSQGRKGSLQQPVTPLHMVPPPTSPSPSSPHRHQL